MTATFGDLARAGTEHLDMACALWEGEKSAESAAAVIRAIHRTVQVMSRCAGDIAGHVPDRFIARPDADQWWQAAAAARLGLTMATEDLRASTQQFGRLGATSASPAALRFGQAASALAAGRDLLQTHRAAGPGGQRLAWSDWSGVIDSPEVAGALLTGIAQWATRLATWLSQPGITDAALPARSRELCACACRGLWTAVAAIEMASKQNPVPEDGKKLLRGIPSAVLPGRHPVLGEEPAGQLCAGVSLSAQRARSAARRAATRAHWSPEATADSWQWTAEAAVIISHISGLLLGTLSRREDLARMYPLSAVQIRAGAQAAARAHAWWQQVAETWDLVTTETRGLTSPAIADTGDLLLRMGRLTFDNPLWTPARAHQAALRSPEDLASNSTGARSVVTAIHQAADALACVAAADLHGVKLASRGWRLHMPTRCLPEQYDIPYPFGPATPAHVAAVLNAYSAAASASTHAAMVLEDLVLTIDAPSAALATARRLTRPVDVTWAADTELSSEPALRRAGWEPVSPQIPGPVEKKLANLGVTDPLTLLQAAAIDHAGRDLIAGAEQAATKFARPGTARPGRAAPNEAPNGQASRTETSHQVLPTPYDPHPDGLVHRR